MFPSRYHPSRYSRETNLIVDIGIVIMRIKDVIGNRDRRMKKNGKKFSNSVTFNSNHFYKLY